MKAETNPLKAVERFREEPFDLVLTDLTMPYLTGLEVARACREARLEVPIVLMTGLNPSLQEDDLTQHGIIDIILKPYGIQALSDAVSGALKSESRKQP